METKRSLPLKDLISSGHSQTHYPKVYDHVHYNELL